MMATVRLLLSVVIVMAVTIDGGVEINRRKRTDEACHVMQNACGYVITMPYRDDCDRVQTENQSTFINDYSKRDDVIISRLNAMQERLTRMIKELSVRTLRHIRQIKSTLHRVRIAVLL
jgi:hypothetical protein